MLGAIPPWRPTIVLRALRALVLLACSCAASANAQTIAATEATAHQAASSESSTLPLPPADIRIGPGDLLEIEVYGVPELKQRTRVDGSGMLYMPLVGYVHAAGLTVSEAQSVTEKALVEGQFLKDPHVAIFLAEYATQGVSVLGQVEKPGVYPVHGDRRLFDVISLAGGLTARAGKNVSITHRDQPSESIVIPLNKDPERVAESNVRISPGDTVVVAKAGVVYVVGDVRKPSGIVMENNDSLTVLQALAVAEGPNRTAALDAAKIVRRTPEGPQEIPIPLKKVLSAQEPDIALHPEDILFVPNSRAKQALGRGLDAILQITTGVLIYRR